MTPPSAPPSASDTPTSRQPLVVGVVAWGLLATGALVLVFPRPGAAWAPWDAWLQMAALAGLFVVLPAIAVFALDAYRAAAAETPDDIARHRLGLALAIGAGAGAAAGWIWFALAAP